MTNAIQVVHDGMIMHARLTLSDLTDYKGRVYRGFTARRDPAHGPGWFVFGTCADGAGRDTYGGTVVARVAEPTGLPRKHRNYNVRCVAGWRTMRAAAAIAAELNRLYPADSVKA